LFPQEQIKDIIISDTAASRARVAEFNAGDLNSALNLKFNDDI